MGDTHKTHLRQLIIRLCLSMESVGCVLGCIVMDHHVCFSWINLNWVLWSWLVWEKLGGSCGVLGYISMYGLLE